jgi:hypothetical protein
MNTARQALSGSEHGGKTSAAAFGGDNPGGNLAATEEWIGDGTLSENID